MPLFFLTLLVSVSSAFAQSSSSYSTEALRWGVTDDLRSVYLEGFFYAREEAPGSHGEVAVVGISPYSSLSGVCKMLGFEERRGFTFRFSAAPVIYGEVGVDGQRTPYRCTRTAVIDENGQLVRYAQGEYCLDKILCMQRAPVHVTTVSTRYARKEYTEDGNVRIVEPRYGTSELTAEWPFNGESNHAALCALYGYRGARAAVSGGRRSILPRYCSPSDTVVWSRRAPSVDGQIERVNSCGGLNTGSYITEIICRPTPAERERDFAIARRP